MYYTTRPKPVGVWSPNRYYWHLWAIVILGLLVFMAVDYFKQWEHKCDVKWVVIYVWVTLVTYAFNLFVTMAVARRYMTVNSASKLPSYLCSMFYWKDGGLCFGLGIMGSICLADDFHCTHNVWAVFSLVTLFSQFSLVIGGLLMAIKSMDQEKMQPLLPSDNLFGPSSGSYNKLYSMAPTQQAPVRPAQIEVTRLEKSHEPDNMPQRGDL